MIDAKQIPDVVDHVIREELGFDKSYSPKFKAALAAALNAWPWAETRVEDWHTPPETVLILSLPQEPRT